MNKLMLLLSFLALGFLTVTSTIDPNISAVWLASPDQSFDVLRSSVMFMLLVLMFTNPPRNVLLRSVIGLATVALIGWTGYMTYEGVIQVLDGIALLAAGISSLIAILEFVNDDEFSKPVISPNFKGVLHS